MRLIEKFRADLAILDVVMPEMDGMETLGRIMRQYKDLPSMLHSSYPHDKEDFFSWPANANLIKFSDSKELKQVSRNLLRKRNEKGLTRSQFS